VRFSARPPTLGGMLAVQLIQDSCGGVVRPCSAILLRSVLNILSLRASVHLYEILPFFYAFM